MTKLIQLALDGAQGSVLRHKYYCQAGGARGLLFCLPGDHYGMDGPLLYHPAQILKQLGWDTFTLTYSYQSKSLPFSPQLISGLLEECQQALHSVLAYSKYRKIGMMGKSLGALITAFLCTNVTALADARAVYLTPPLGSRFFDPLFSETSQPAYVALGSADRFFDEDEFLELRGQKDFRFRLIKDADHSLTIPGDLDETIAAEKLVTEEVVDFLEED
jgi:hypothetical protein